MAWIQASHKPVLDPEGHAVKVIQFATDITEVKRSGSIGAIFRGPPDRLTAPADAG